MRSREADSKPGTGFELKESRCADDSRIESEDDCKEAAANKGVPWGGCIHASCPGLKLPSTAFPPGCVLLGPDVYEAAAAKGGFPPSVKNG